MDTISYKVPLGVTASICPFNFPAMIPLWSFPLSVACGNTVIMKPSERVPGAAMLLAELFAEAGAPPGTLNIIHGQHEAVDFICEHPDIKAISFVGSDQAVSSKICLSLFFLSYYQEENNNIASTIEISVSFLYSFVYNFRVFVYTYILSFFLAHIVCCSILSLNSV